MPGKGAANRNKVRTPNSTPRASPRPHSAGSARASPRPASSGSLSGYFPVSKLDLSGTNNHSGLSTPHSGKEVCICKICTCGKHNCPVQAKTDIFFGDGGGLGLSTTQGDYMQHDSKHYQAGLTRACPTHGYSPSRIRFDGTTTHQASYPWHDPSISLERSSPSPMHKAHTRIHDPDTAMDLTTSYASNYVQHAIPQRAAAPTPQSYSYGPPRAMKSSHQLDFTGKQPPPCPAMGLPARPASHRSGHTKYTQDFNGTWQ